MRERYKRKQAREKGRESRKSEHSGAISGLAPRHSAAESVLQNPQRHYDLQLSQTWEPTVAEASARRLQRREDVESRGCIRSGPLSKHALPSRELPGAETRPSSRLSELHHRDHISQTCRQKNQRPSAPTNFPLPFPPNRSQPVPDPVPADMNALIGSF